MSRRFIGFASVLIVGLIGCKTARQYAGPPPLPPGGGAPLLSDAEIETARTLYFAKCANCHKFHSPAKYSEDEWQTWMRKMSKKAKLNETQTEALSRYLELFRRPAGTNSEASAATKSQLNHADGRSTETPAARSR